MTVRVSWTWGGTILRTSAVAGGHGVAGPGTAGPAAGAAGTAADGGMVFGSAFFSWATAANGTTTRSAPAKTNLRTLNIGTSPIPKWSPAVAASLIAAKPLTPTFDIHGEYSPRR